MGTFIAIVVSFLIGVGVGFKYQDIVELKYAATVQKIKDYVSTL